MLLNTSAPYLPCKHTAVSAAESHTHHTHLLTVADALLFEAQLSFQVLDDGVLRSLDVGVGGDARRPADQRLLGKRFAEARTKQKMLSTLKLLGTKGALLKVISAANALPSRAPPRSLTPPPLSGHVQL